MEWENAVDHDTSYSDFNYPTEGQVISAQMGLFPHSLKWLNPNLSDGPGNYKFYRLKCGWKLPAHLDVEGCRCFNKPIFVFHFLCSEPEVSMWLTVGMKIVVKILLKLCISNLKQDQCEYGGIIFLIATSGIQPYNVGLFHVTFVETGVKNTAWCRAEK